MKKSTAILPRLYLAAHLMGGAYLCSSHSLAIQGKTVGKITPSAASTKRHRSSVKRKRKHNKGTHKQWFSGRFTKKHAYVVVGIGSILGGACIWWGATLYGRNSNQASKKPPSPDQPDVSPRRSSKFYITNPLREETYSVNDNEYTYHIFDVAADNSCWTYVTIAFLTDEITMNQQTLEKFDDKMSNLLQGDLKILEGRVKAYRKKLQLAAAKIMAEGPKEEYIEYFLQALVYHVFVNVNGSEDGLTVDLKESIERKYIAQMKVLLPEEEKRTGTIDILNDLNSILKSSPKEKLKSEEKNKKINEYISVLRKDPPDVTCITKLINSRLRVCELYMQVLEELPALTQDVVASFDHLLPLKGLLRKLEWLNSHPNDLARLVRFVRVMAIFCYQKDPEIGIISYNFKKILYDRKDEIEKKLSPNGWGNPTDFNFPHFFGYEPICSTSTDPSEMAASLRSKPNGEMPLVAIDVYHHFNFGVPVKRL